MNETLKQEFEHPSGQYRGKPFWSWNGKLDRAELLRQVDILKEMGFGGYFMHSRVGLATEYLGDDWFDLINACTDHGAALGMENWLYDEDRWPSGTAGGMVTKNPEYRMKFLELTQSDRYEYDPDAVIAFGCRLTNDGYTDARILRKDDSLGEGETANIFRVVEMAQSDFYNGYTYADTMKLEATEDFIARTHEQYAKRCGDRTGKTIQGIFTDEPHRGPLFANFSGGSPNRAPYTDHLFEEFQSRYGYDLKNHLLELFLVREIRQVKWQYTDLTQQLFLENFAKPIHDWCAAHQMKFTGHVLQEDHLANQIAMQGSMMRFYEWMDYPGIDILSENNLNYWVAKQVSSVARQLGKKQVLSELYGCTGWQMNFESHKTVGDWQALFGINLRCQHLSWYTMAGEAKRDYPASILHQSAWYPYYSYVEDYFARINTILAAGTPDCNLLVISPIESISARVYSGCFSWLNAADARMQELTDMYESVFHQLAGARIDFDYADEEMLSRLGRVSGTSLTVGQMTYTKVLVAGMDTIRSSTIHLLRQFAEAGGQVFLAGVAPAYVDAVPSAEFETVKILSILLDKVADQISSGTEVTILSEKDTSLLYAQTRRVGRDRFVVLMNMDRKHGPGNVTLCLGKGNGVKRLNARTGKVEPATFTLKDGNVYLEDWICAGEEKIYMVEEEGQPLFPPEKKSGTPVSVPSAFPYTLDEPNICVLDFVRYRIDGGDWSEELEILQADREIRSHFSLPYRGGEMVQPWFQTKQTKGAPPDILGTVELSFIFHADNLQDNTAELVLEHAMDFEATLNGHSINTSETNGKWIDICFDRLAVPSGVLKTGKNELVLKTKFHQQCDLEAAYLLGNFGVTLNGEKPSITALPQTLQAGDITTQGLPFYSGSITYHTQMKETAGKAISVTLPDFGGACALVNGQICAFLPYRTEPQLCQDGMLDITVVLTRRNTFGPLHETDKIKGSYGPDSFVPQGGRFMKGYQLFEQGLLAAPEVTVYSS